MILTTEGCGTRRLLAQPGFAKEQPRAIVDRITNRQPDLAAVCRRILSAACLRLKCKNDFNERPMSLAYELVHIPSSEDVNAAAIS